MKNLLVELNKIAILRPPSKIRCQTSLPIFGGWDSWTRKLTTTTTPSSAPFPTHAQVVICGSGLVGNSVAHHLIQHGIRDIVMLRLPGHSQSSEGTIAAQLGRPISRLKSFQEEGVIRESFTFYKSLHDQGHDIGLSSNGGLYLAQTELSLFKIKIRANNLPWSSNLKVEVLTPTDIKNRFPYINTEDILGGAFVPEDTVAIPSRVNKVMTKLMADGGVKIVHDCNFKQVLVKDGKVVAAETELGTIKCDYFVNCAGWFAWEYGQKQEPAVRIPAHPVARQYLKTKPIIDDVPFPTVTDYDSNVYLTKLIDNSMVVGTFEKKAKPIFTDGVPSNWLEEITPDWDHFAPALDSAIRRVPTLKTCRTDKFVCEADAFSPDCFWIIGEAPEIKNYFVGAATNGNALQVAGGMGAYLAHWIAKGERHAPLLDFDILRFVDVHNCRKFLRDRVSESVGKQYEPMISYNMHYKTARIIRCSPLHATLNERGAVNGEIMGYERPLYFDPKTPNLKGDIMPPISYHKPSYLDHVKREYDACLEGVGVADMSSYAKFHIWSPRREVVDFLQKLCSNNIDIPVGTITPTGMHNEHGGYESDCILGRTAENKYILLTPTVLQTRTPTWMSKFMPQDNSVFLKDVSSMFSCIQLIGPKACSVVSKLAHCDMSMKTFRFKEVTLACAPQVQVVTYTNTLEPGFSLLIPSEFALHVYREIMKIGRDYGIRDVGLYAHQTLRMEKNLCFWGDEIHMYSTPAEVGRVSRIDNTKDFIGKDAILRQIKEGVKKRIAFFKLSQDDNEFSMQRDQWPWGGEPIFRNGVYVGQTTSAMYGFTSEAMIVYAFITKPDRKTGEMEIVTKDYILDKEALYHIDIGGKRVKIFPYLSLRRAEPHPATDNVRSSISARKVRI